MCTGAVVGPGRLAGSAAVMLAIVAAFGLFGVGSPHGARAALFCFAAALSALNATPAGASALAELARSVPSCDVTGHVVESHGGLGTLVAIEGLQCEYADGSGVSGVAIVDDLTVDPGSSLRAAGWLVPLGDDAFARARAKTGATAELDLTDHTSAPPTHPVHRTSAFLRSSLRSATSHLADPRSGLLRGLSIGDTDQIDVEMKERFRRSGLSHLVAVSGSNVAIVVGAVALAAARAALRLRIALSLMVLALYVAVVGPDPSVLRAAAMGTMILIAVATGRTTEPLAALGVAVVVCVGLRPELATAPGLHLSVAATAGIVVGARRLEASFSVLPKPIAMALSVTVAAQIAVAPILIATFGELSIVAPLANLAAVPAVAPATILTLLAGIAEPLTPQIVGLLIWPADLCARWILACAGFFGDLSFASVSLPLWVAGLPLPALLFVGVRAYRVVTMSEFHWRTLDAEGNEVSRSEAFASKEEAEAWMGAEWEGLVQLGGRSVSLRSNGDELYNMSLEPA